VGDQFRAVGNLSLTVSNALDECMRLETAAGGALVDSPPLARCVLQLRAYMELVPLLSAIVRTPPFNPRLSPSGTLRFGPLVFTQVLRAHLEVDPVYGHRWAFPVERLPTSTLMPLERNHPSCVVRAEGNASFSIRCTGLPLWAPFVHRGSWHAYGLTLFTDPVLHTSHSGVTLHEMGRASAADLSMEIEGPLPPFEEVVEVVSQYEALRNRTLRWRSPPGGGPPARMPARHVVEWGGNI
jgi:hypothetical protein